MHSAAEGKKMCDSTSGWELIFQIYLSGNGLEPTEASHMAPGWTGMDVRVESWRSFLKRFFSNPCCL